MTVSIGLLSTAHGHANAYAEVLTDIDGARVVAVADENETRGESFAEQHDIEYRSVENVLEAVDAVIVCAANADHARWVKQAAAAGVDVLCEKPLAPTAEAASEMVDICRKEGVLLGTAMPARFLEPIQRVKSEFDAGTIGDLKAVTGTNLLQAMAVAEDSWFVDPEQSGGGAIMDHSVHIVDLVRWISGQELTEVYTETGTQFRDIPVEDINVLSLELEDGTPVTHDGSWRQPKEWDHWGDVSIRLIGTEGVLEADYLGQTLKHTRDTGDDPGIESVYWGSDMNEGLLRDFVTAVRDGHEPEIPGREGLREVKVVEAAYRSADEGEPVSIDY